MAQKAYDEVKSTLQAFLDRKNKRKKNTAIEPVIYGLVVDLVLRFGKIIPTSQVWSAITSGGVSGLYDSKKPNDYQTEDYDVIKREPISKTICDNFGAEREHMRDGNAFVFDLEKLVKAGKVYDIEVKIQSRLDREACEGRERREVQNSPTAVNNDKKVIEIDEKGDIICNKNSGNQKTPEKMKDKKGSTTITYPSQPSQPSQSEPDDGPYSCPQCDRRLRTLDLYKQHIKGGHKTNKVAEAAEANQSGNGIMPV